ncbi:putative mitochondrial C-14 sterol reductase [Leptomonas pyrrhocoris]|uniref:Delta(14)-sterol reductase ERG24 n=1 Tax=Leptomonas pyrrhocoris TaxID=157538 RepID=A0A0M9G8R6_LEPPY|nr:putative mitochondrial C-14 sterol reductase [Leptomonas pyrrhocoris]XP_015663256.1 putative mitochondrial C-14 sterol reductase [Leptomonas pyrrhocoris]KPA84816.1 putative mitochondrial C-14 sterol reductase [Leptomonas pyrrhocoris]KPA84817.1 putative mitochondrial C-14 sterol reductase [Leptomonas pyrrhocoris]|eukprot:XP_015663255.1 putative mitochondrial C-14 sterol reductase [Leptomonas pyrrhocoris]
MAKRSTSSPNGANSLQPRTKSYEWGGPVGSLFMVAFLPALVVALNCLCAGEECSVMRAWRLPLLMQEVVQAALPQVPTAIGLELAWLAAHAIFSILPIGKLVHGGELRNGQRLAYRMNAMHAFVLSHALIFLLHYTSTINLAVLADLYHPLMIGAIVISFAMSVVLYVASYRSRDVLTALGGNSGNTLYDFWVGRELNPRTGPLDWKLMCELRPGLIGWSILNWAFVVKSMEIGTVTPSIVLIALFESFYVLDGLVLEAGNLTMMDIVTDGFGFMLCFGDLAWVPFTYTLQTKYLVHHPARLTPVHLGLCSLLALAGYSIFRGANTEKDRFRTNPQDPRVRHLKVMKTSKGKSLIVSGYWGMCRHPNYVGDWLMAVGWASFSGTAAVLPYFHPIYFGILLMHRQLRDEQQMTEKYGEEDWKAFCKAVPYRLFPYIY